MYLYVQAVHIVFVVSWFAGLFYMPRLLIYHTEASLKPEPAASILKNQFGIMEKKLWQIITAPAMILTLVTGTAMVVINPSLLQQSWLHAKLTFVLILVIYHFLTRKIYLQIQGGNFKRSSNYLRIWNEGATILLVAIVFLVVVKNSLSWIYGVVGLVLLGILLGLGIRLYKRLSAKQTV